MRLTYKSITLALLLYASAAYGQALSTLPGTSCASCASIVLRGTNGVQQPTSGQTQISGIAVSWSTGANERTIEIFNQGTLPANGPVTPYYCYVINSTAGPTAGTVTLDWNVHPLKTLVGCVIAISIDPAGCTQLTLDGSTNRIDLQAQSP